MQLHNFIAQKKSIFKQKNLTGNIRAETLTRLIGILNVIVGVIVSFLLDIKHFYLEMKQRQGQHNKSMRNAIY